MNKKRFCGARARQNKNKGCRRAPMKNGRCNLHGGKSTGPKTPEGKFNSSRANYKHGHYTKEAIAERKMFGKTLSQWKQDLAALNEKIQIEIEYNEKNY